MMRRDPCPSAEVFTAYVTGELPSSIEHGFETHVATCPACAKLLEQAACLETMLHEAADRLAASRPRSWIRRFKATSHELGAVAAAACVLLTLGLSSPWLHDEQARDAALARASATSLEPPACTPTLDESSCEDTTFVAHREDVHIPWTELPESIDPATCWSEDDGPDLVCAPTDASG